MNLTNFRFEIDADGIALVTWDMPGRSMNVINAEVIAEIGQIVDKIVERRGDQRRGHHFRQEAFSAAPISTMLQIAGDEFARRAKAEGKEAAMRAFVDQTKQLNLVYRRLETCGKPVAAAINGVCMGGGFELALACHYRVVADSDKARVGLPEIKVGLFPGGGGTQRVARLMPTPDALQMLFKGEQLRPAVGQEDGSRARGRAGRPSRAARQSLGKGQSERQGAMGRSKIQAALGQGLFANGHDDLAAGERDLSPRDL